MCLCLHTLLQPAVDVAHFLACACVFVYPRRWWLFPQPECVCVLIEAISWRVCVVCVLSEECRAGSAPPGEDDVMADSFLFCEPVEQTESQLHGWGWGVITGGPGFSSPLA